LKIMVRNMLNSDSQKVLEIYRMGLESKNATFEIAVPSWQEWDSKHLLILFNHKVLKVCSRALSNPLGEITLCALRKYFVTFVVNGFKIIKC
jgi:hypothetical protein